VARFVVRRVGLLALTLVVTSLVIFLVTWWLPGDVARVILGREAGEAALAALRVELGLDRPLAEQYARWLGRFAVGDWGVSFSTGQPIRPMVAERLGHSLRLAALTLALAVPLAVALGVAAGLRRGRWVDHVVSVGALAVVGLPEFVTGLVLVHVFAFELRWLPASSGVAPGAPWREALPQMVLPALTATLVLVAYVARLTRAGVIEELAQPYVRTAMLRGLPPWRVLTGHVLRNALRPTVTVVAISLGWLVSGLVVVENVFNYPGLGRLLTFAIDRRDIPLLQAITMVAVTGYALANLAADLVYAWLDPRIRLE